MAEAQLQQFLAKVRQLNAFVALSEADPQLRRELRDCEHHDQVVALARRCGFEIGRRWGEPLPHSSPAEATPVWQASPPQGAGDAGPPASVGPAQPPFAAGAHLPAAGKAPASPADSEPHPEGPLGSAVAAAHACAASQPHPAGGSHAASSGAADPLAAAALEPGLGDRLQSLLCGPCPPPGEEITSVLLETPQWRLERIHSCAHRSPDDFWYEQEQEEWVLLLQGSAALRFADQPGEQRLGPGDSLRIRAGRRHQVTATDPDPGTIWLALFWRPA